MESPVRSGDNGAGGTEAETANSPSSSSSVSQQQQRQFEAKTYLERQVEELSCADEEEAQEKLSQRLQLKHERAKKKRDIQLQRRRRGIAERLRKIRDAREAVDARFAENAALLMERQAEKQTSATRRRRTSLENIKKARAVHNRRVSQRRRESFDATSELSPSRSQSMDEIESKLARAERNREALRCERRRRTMERYEEGRARAVQQGLLGLGGGGGAGMVRGSTPGVEAGREHRRRRAMEARHAAKARQAQRMRDLRQRMLSYNSRVAERKTRLYAARLLQAWWRSVRAGQPFDVADLTLTSAEPPPPRTTLGSPSSWVATQGLGLVLPNGSEFASACGKFSNQEARSPLDPITKSPLPTFRKFSTGVGAHTLETEDVGELATAVISSSGQRDGRSSPTTTYGFGSNHEAAVRIQSFLRRNMHTLKVANALVAGRLSIKVLCAAVRTMETSSFDEAIDVMSTRAIVSHCETTLKALRMGREMRTVPQTVRSARAFLSALLVNFFPTSALDDEGALSSSPEGTAPLQVEKDRLVRAAGNAIGALIDLEAIVDETAGCEGDETMGRALNTEQFRRIRRASGRMVRARVAFCQRFAEWKRKDAVRLADEMTASSVDVLLMQLRAERDLRVAAVRYGLDETDDDGALFSTGYNQIKEGTQRQLGKMMHALGKLVGTEEARQRMDEATDAAFERLRADELAEDEEFMREHGEFADERMMRMDTDESDQEVRGDSPRAEGRQDVEAQSGADATGISASEAAAALVGTKKAAKDENDIAGPRRPLSAGDLLSNEWLVHEVMISDESLTVTLEEAIDNHLLRSGNPAAAHGSIAAADDFWAKVERNVASEDYTPLLGLVAELRDKIIGLTPRRRDLAEETCEAMDVELLEQMMTYGAFDVGSFFRMIAFAGERVLELEAPIRNEGTKATLAEWGRTQDEVEGGRRRLEPAMVRECFEYLFSKTDEIHVDILNAHLQIVTPFLKQHGVEYERDRFTEKLDAGETSLDMTHLWLHRAIRNLRAAAAAPTPTITSPPVQSVASAGGVPLPPPPPVAVTAEALFYRQLLSDLEQQRGDAYLKLLRVAIVDNLLGAIVRVERKSGCSAMAVTGDKGDKSGPLASAASPRDDQQEDMLEGVAVPETLILDQYRLVVVAAGAEQAAYTASLVAFARQALAGVRVALARVDEDKMREALMVLFETEDVTSADITAQVGEMTRVVAINAGRALPSAQLSILSARAKNVLTTGDCPVYKLFLRRTLVLLRDALVEGGMQEARFEGVLRKAGLFDYKTFLLERVVRPLMVIERHNEAVFATFYNEIIPLALQTTDPAAIAAHAEVLSSID